MDNFKRLSFIDVEWITVDYLRCGWNKEALLKIIEPEAHIQEK